MKFKIGDRVKVVDKPNELSHYGVRSLAGKTVIIRRFNGESHEPAIRDLSDLIEVPPGSLAIDVSEEGSDEVWWVMDFHLIPDEDSLPYDEWVKVRDWNKIYREKTNKSLRELFHEAKR